MTHEIKVYELSELFPIVPRCWLHLVKMQPVFEDGRQKRWRCSELTCDEVHIDEKSN